MDYSGSTKFEGKMVHWRLKGCYLNALSYKDTFKVQRGVFEYNLNVLRDLSVGHDI